MDIKTLQLMLALEPFYNTVKKPKKSQAHADEGDSTTHIHGRCIKSLFLMLDSKLSSLDFCPCQGHVLSVFFGKKPHSHNVSFQRGVRENVILGYPCDGWPVLFRGWG